MTCGYLLINLDLETFVSSEYDNPKCKLAIRQVLSSNELLQYVL